jgi:hypothetical protein
VVLLLRCRLLEGFFLPEDKPEAKTGNPASYSVSTSNLGLVVAICGYSLSYYVSGLANPGLKTIALCFTKVKLKPDRDTFNRREGTASAVWLSSPPDSYSLFTSWFKVSPQRTHFSGSTPYTISLLAHASSEKGTRL